MSTEYQHGERVTCKCGAPGVYVESGASHAFTENTIWIRDNEIMECEQCWAHYDAKFLP